MPAASFTATSCCRSSASYFSGCNTARRRCIRRGRPSKKGQIRFVTLHSPLVRARTNGEHYSSPPPPAVEKHDGRGEGGDFVPSLGLGCWIERTGERHGR